MDEDDARHLAFTLGRQSDPGKDAGGLSTVGKGVVVDRPDRAVRLEAFGFVGLRRGGAGVDEPQHDLAVSRGLGEEGGGEHEQAEQGAHGGGGKLGVKS